MVGGFRGKEGMMEEGRKVEKDDQRREQEEIKRGVTRTDLRC